MNWEETEPDRESLWEGEAVDGTRSDSYLLHSFPIQKSNTALMCACANSLFEVAAFILRRGEFLPFLALVSSCSTLVRCSIAEDLSTEHLNCVNKVLGEEERWMMQLDDNICFALCLCSHLIFRLVTLLYSMHCFPRCSLLVPWFFFIQIWLRSIWIVQIRYSFLFLLLFLYPLWHVDLSRLEQMPSRSRVRVQSLPCLSLMFSLSRSFVILSCQKRFFILPWMPRYLP